MTLEKRNSLEPWISDDLHYYDHQIEGIRRMANMRSVLLADEMGLGKTLQTLTVFVIDLKLRMENPDMVSFYGEKMLVVCPATLKENWGEEIAKFTTVPHVVLRGDPRERARKLARFANKLTGPRILVVGYEQMIIHHAELNAMNFHMVAFDEAHRIKNWRSKTSKAALALIATRSILITGSPVLNQVDELWPMLERISPGEWGSYFKFTQRYCIYGGYGGKSIVGPKNTQELNLRLNAVMVRRLKKDVLDLPEVQYVDRVVGLHREQKKLYDQAREELKLELANGETKDIQNGMVKLTRLIQICGTTRTINPDTDWSDKLETACDDAREIMDSGYRLVVFTRWRAVQDGYVSRLVNNGSVKKSYPVWVINGDTPSSNDGRDFSDPKKRLSRLELIHQWSNHPEPGVVICTYQSAGVGLNMTAASYLQRVDRLFVPKLNDQAVDRVHRIGARKTRPITVLDYLVKGSAEDRIEKIVRTKRRIFDSVVEQDAFDKKLLQAVLEDGDI